MTSSLISDNNAHLEERGERREGRVVHGNSAFVRKLVDLTPQSFDLRYLGKGPSQVQGRLNL